ncbi:hypothetical protein [Nocardia crassostreae]|uniref:hypothetical protein n=1 Tax=Nocardia crassostreae TaxID=53428 RepID=UPI00082CF110|nr:hypothetical protein [Nocardia crassostreae]
MSLRSAEETTPIDEPGQPDPTLDADLILYILAGSLQPADRRALTAIPRDRVLVILNKADTIGTRWSDAATAAESHSATLGLPVFPVVATLAAHTRAGTLTTADMQTLHRHRTRTDPAFTLAPGLFNAPDLGIDTANRQLLLTRWELYGVACALTALRHDPTLPPRTLLHVLHCASGIDPVHEELHRRYEPISIPHAPEIPLARIASPLVE